MAKRPVVLSATTIIAVMKEIDESFDADTMTRKEIGVICKVMDILKTMQEERSDIRGPIE